MTLYYFAVVIAALGFLMFMAYKGHSLSLIHI